MRLASFDASVPDAGPWAGDGSQDTEKGGSAVSGDFEEKGHWRDGAVESGYPCGRDSEGRGSVGRKPGFGRCRRKGRASMALCAGRRKHDHGGCYVRSKFLSDLAAVLS